MNKAHQGVEPNHTKQNVKLGSSFHTEKPSLCRHRVMVEHQCCDGNKGDNTKRKPAVINGTISSYLISL